MKKVIANVLKVALTLLIALGIFIAGEWSADSNRYKGQKIDAELSSAWTGEDKPTFAVDPFLKAQRKWGGEQGERRCYRYADNITSRVSEGRFHIPIDSFHPLLSKRSSIDEGWVVFFLAEVDGKEKRIFSCWVESNGSVRVGRFVKRPYDFPLSTSEEGATRQFNAMLDQLEMKFPPLNPRSENYTEQLVGDLEMVVAAYEERGVPPQMSLKLAAKERLGIDLYVPAP